MSTIQLTAEQKTAVDKLLKDLEYKGFNHKDFHRENLSKHVAENKEQFSVKDLSYSKKVDFTITYTKNKNGNYQLSILGHHKEKGTYAKFPLAGVVPRKDVFENFLDGRAFLANIDKWNKEENKFEGKETAWLSMNENPCTSAQDAEKMWGHTKSYSHKMFSIKEEFFGHSITETEKKDLEKGYRVDFKDCVDLKTGEIMEVTGIVANPARQKLSYNETVRTGNFVSPEFLNELNERYKKSEKTTPVTEEYQEEQQVENKSVRKGRKIA